MLISIVTSVQSNESVKYSIAPLFCSIFFTNIFATEQETFSLECFASSLNLPWLRRQVSLELKVYLNKIENVYMYIYIYIWFTYYNWIF